MSWPGVTYCQGEEAEGRKALRGVVRVARQRRRSKSRRTRRRTGHNTGWPLGACPVDSPRAPFFWVENVKET